MTVKHKDDVIVDGEEIEALVKMDILELLEKPRQFIIDYLALHAIGSENIGQFILDEFEMELVGMMKQDLLFEVRGVARKVNTKTKKSTNKPVKRGSKKA